MNFAFGPLPTPLSAQSTNWQVAPFSTYPARIRAWQNIGTDRQWVYPPIRFSARIVSGRQIRIPGSGREVVVWRPPTTHRLTFVGTPQPVRLTAKRGVAALLVYLIGALYGVELQHRSWMVTWRHHKRTGGLFVSPVADVGRAMDRAASWFLTAPKQARIAMIGGLFLHNHVPSYIWDWEQFAWQYSAFDAAWRVARLTGLIGPPPNGREWPHAQRFRKMATTFGIQSDAGIFSRWVRCRNDLVHQVTWGRYTPGHKPPMAVSHLYLTLRGFTTIALLAAMGLRGGFRRAHWKGVSQSLFQVI
jgi:hypothetical protein